jgi:hypothetical protein
LWHFNEHMAEIAVRFDVAGMAGQHGIVSAHRREITIWRFSVVQLQISLWTVPAQNGKTLQVGQKCVLLRLYN